MLGRCSPMRSLAVRPRVGEGGGGLPKKMGGGVQPASKNSYSIYDQTMRISVPYLCPDQKFDTLFMT